MIKKNSSFLLWLKENKITLTLFFFSTAYIFFQHSQGINWDFATYVLNAKYWFADGWYFEALRPPLMPFLLGILSVLGWINAEYIYIFLVSILYLYSSVNLAKQLKLSDKLFYFLGLNFYVLLYGMQNGTELLSLALLQLFITALLQKKTGGLFLGLACLTRYNLFIFTILILFYKKPKKILINALLFLIPLIPWFYYNATHWGNMFASILDNYALNVLFRLPAYDPVNLGHFLTSINILLPVFFVGLFISFKKKLSEEKIIFLINIILVLISYFSLPAKSDRFLFLLVTPSIYFSAIGLESMRKYCNKYFKPQSLLIASQVLLTFIVISFAYFTSDSVLRSYISDIKSSIVDMKNSGFDDCKLKSNTWIYYNYFGIKTEPFAFRENVESYLKEGYWQILFLNQDLPGYQHDEKFIKEFQNIKKTKNYLIFFSEKCSKPRKKLAGLAVYAIDYEYKKAGKTNILSDNFCENFNSFPIKTVCLLGKVSYQSTD